MAHFAEIDSNNKVLRVVVGCNQDVINNGGDQSKQAAKHFENIVKLSENGVEWIQTSYNKNFRKNYAGVGSTYDSVKDIFINVQPYPSWTLDQNDDWQPPIPEPNVLKYTVDENGVEVEYLYFIYWNETNLNWKAKTRTLPIEDFTWNNETNTWIKD